jgi:hypothetical protein
MGETISYSVHQHRNIVFEQSYRWYGYLTFLTAQYVLDLWNAEIPTMLHIDETIDVDIPQRLLSASKAMLNNMENAGQDAYNLVGEAYEWLGATVYSVSYRARCAASACLKACQMILGDTPFRYSIQATTTDSDIDWSQGDVALLACQAYTTIQTRTPPSSANEYHARMNVYFDLALRQRFWEWWLTTALPAAYTQAYQ